MHDGLYTDEPIGMTDGCTSVNWPDKKQIQNEYYDDLIKHTACKDAKLRLRLDVDVDLDRRPAL